MKDDPRFHERLADYDLLDPDSKREYNLRVFSKVALRYDLVTRILSLGRDGAWKRSLCRLVPSGMNLRILDIATGTGDLAGLLSLRFPDASIIGIDLNPEMIRRASRAMTSRTGKAAVEFRLGDMGRLEFPDASFNLVTGGYALRNAPDPAQALREIARVLAPGGVAAFLDFSLPADGKKRRAQLGLLRFWGGLWGRVFHGNPEVYSYIAESLSCFPDREALGTLAAASGFRVRKRLPRFFGFMELNIWEKPAAEGRMPG